MPQYAATEASPPAAAMRSRRSRPFIGRPLIPAAPGSALLVTARRPLPMPEELTHVALRAMARG
ncbi:hypothetical protein ACFY36_48075 [Actinoplanes sp. NPDC000266]